MRNIEVFLLTISRYHRCIFRSTRRKFCIPITKPALFTEVSPPQEDTADKVTIVGVGKVGTACAFTLLCLGISSDVVLVNRNHDKMLGQTLDFQHGSLFLNNPKIEAATNYEKTADSKVCIIAAGTKRRTITETRFSLARKNVDIFKSIIPKIIKYSPNTILIIVSNPVDIMTYTAWKLSGLPNHKVIGSGTNLDTARFRVGIANKLGIPASHCHGYIIGEHGQDQIPVWSSINMAGVKLIELNPNAGNDKDDEKWIDIHRKVVESPQDIIALKGHTCWAIALSVAHIVKSILRNTTKIHAVTTNIKGIHDIAFDVFLSLPCVLNARGLHKIVKQPLTTDEMEKLLRTANIHQKFMKSLKL